MAIVLITLSNFSCKLHFPSIYTVESRYPAPVESEIVFGQFEKNSHDGDLRQ